MTDKQFIYLAYAVFCIFFGIYDGILYYLANKEKKMPKLHPHYPAIAMRVLVAAIFCMFINSSWWGMLKDLAALGAVLSFYHNGFYYETRRILDKPKGYWFFGQSTTSTGLLEFNGLVRTILLVAGTIAYFFWEI